MPSFRRGTWQKGKICRKPQSKGVLYLCRFLFLPQHLQTPRNVSIVELLCTHEFVSLWKSYGFLDRLFCLGQMCSVVFSFSKTMLAPAWQILIVIQTQFVVRYNQFTLFWQLRQLNSHCQINLLRCAQADETMTLLLQSSKLGNNQLLRTYKIKIKKYFVKSPWNHRGKINNKYFIQLSICLSTFIVTVISEQQCAPVPGALSPIMNARRVGTHDPKLQFSPDAVACHELHQPLPRIPN